MQKDVILTPEGLDKLKQEIEHLSVVRRREVAERIKEAREFGDISENSEYDDANGGTAELAGYTLKLHEARRHTLEHVVGDLFPHGGDLSKAEFWCGLRPMTPDGTPLVGPTDIGNLYLATGHGTLGWTMAAGTARVIADLISGRSPEIDLAGLTLARYRRST